MQVAAHGGTDMEPAALLAAVAEQLKVPLTVIARQAELGQLTGQPAAVDAQSIRTQADAALQLVDSYLLGLQLMHSQTQLDLEPVSIASTLVDAAHTLERFAKQYGVQLEVQVAGKFQPVMAHARGLRAALLSLGFALVEMRAAQDSDKPRRITLATHRTPKGIITGLYGDYDGLAADQWRASLKTYGRVPQPLTALSQGSGAGLFVAEAIFRSMDSALRVGQYQRQSGLAVTLQPSRQLQFV